MPPPHWDLLRWGNLPVHIICHFLIWSRLHDRWSDPLHVTSPIWGPPALRKLNVFSLPCRGIEGIIWLIRLLSLLNWNNRLLGDFFQTLVTNFCHPNIFIGMPHFQIQMFSLQEFFSGWLTVREFLASAALLRIFWRKFVHAPFATRVILLNPSNRL